MAQSTTFWRLQLHIPVGSGLCRTCRGEFSNALAVEETRIDGKLYDIQEIEVSIKEEQPLKRERSTGSERPERPSKLAAYAKLQKQHSLLSGDSFIQSSGEMAEVHPEVKEVIDSAAVKVLSEALQKLEPNFERLDSPFNTSSCEKVKRQNVQQFAEILDIELETLLPDSTPEEKANFLDEASQKVRESLTGFGLSAELQMLIDAYLSTTNRTLRLQYLSGLAQKMTLSEIHTHVDSNVSRRRFTAVRKLIPLTQPDEKKPGSRQKLDPKAINHYVSFVLLNFTKDLAYGTKKIQLDDGGSRIIANVVLNAQFNAVQEEYLKYLDRYNQYAPENEKVPKYHSSTYRRILEKIPFTKAKAMAGLDYISSDGNAGLDFLIELSKKLPTILDTDKRELIDRIQKARRFLKYKFKRSVEEGESECSYHCLVFGLSEPKDDLGIFSAECECINPHNTMCDQCLNIEGLLELFISKLQALGEPYRWEMHKMKDVSKSIQAWKRHVLRGIQQEKAKADCMELVSPNRSLIIVDFAMKRLGRMFRESQSSFFGKKGNSWHMLCEIYRDEEGKIHVNTYVHLLGQETQDWFTSLSSVENLLGYIGERKNGHQVDLRCDNAGNYHTIPFILGTYLAGKRSGVLVNSVNFSERQCGKDICDRKIALCTKSMDTHLRSGKDVINAQDMEKALLNVAGIRGCEVTVGEVQRDRLKKVATGQTISGINKLNNFEFGQNTVTAFQQYKIGTGKIRGLFSRLAKANRECARLPEVSVADEVEDDEALADYDNVEAVTAVYCAEVEMLKDIIDS